MNFVFSHNSDHDKEPEGGAAALLEAVEDVLGLAAVYGQAGEVRPIPGGRPVHKETFCCAKTLQKLFTNNFIFCVQVI